MAGAKIVQNGHKISLNRTWKASPDYTAATKFKIGTGTTDPTTADTDIETVQAINGGNTKNFVTGYPVLDETNLQSTIRALLLSTEGNDSPDPEISEWAVFNTDSTPKMFFRATFNPFTKDVSTQGVFVAKAKMA